MQNLSNKLIALYCKKAWWIFQNFDSMYCAVELWNTDCFKTPLLWNCLRSGRNIFRVTRTASHVVQFLEQQLTQCIFKRTTVNDIRCCWMFTLGKPCSSWCALAVATNVAFNFSSSCRSCSTSWFNRFSVSESSESSSSPCNSPRNLIRWRVRRTNLIFQEYENMIKITIRKKQM